MEKQEGNSIKTIAYNSQECRPLSKKAGFYPSEEVANAHHVVKRNLAAVQLHPTQAGTHEDI